MKLIEYPDRDMMAIDVANHLAGELTEHLMVNGDATLAVPGGSTPGPVFDALCAADLEWDKVTVLPTDERWVPESSEHSNARLIRERLLTGRAAAASFLPLYVEGRQPEDCVDELTEQLEPHLPLSVVVLGMGADMHTASLFPGIDALRKRSQHDADEAVLPIRIPGLGPVETRMSLGVAPLDGAMSKHILITGADKRAALENARKLGDPVAAPILAVLPGATVHWAE